MHNQHEPHAAAPEASAAPPSVLVVDDDNFFDQTEGRITIIDFWAQWCAPCRAFAPIFEAASSDYLGQATFAKCDVDASPRTAALLQIQSIPTLVVFGRDGSEISRVVGGIPRRHLDAIIEQVAPAPS
jgi:thioredoxin